jgi:hypothetical protein
MVAILDFLRVGTHAQSFPTTIARDAHYLVPVFIEGTHHDHGVMVAQLLNPAVRGRRSPLVLHLLVARDYVRSIRGEACTCT